MACDWSVPMHHPLPARRSDTPGSASIAMSQASTESRLATLEAELGSLREQFAAQKRDGVRDALTAALASPAPPEERAAAVLAATRRAGTTAALLAARLCFRGMVGRAGGRTELRAVGMCVLDAVLAKHPACVDGLVMKGEGLCPIGFGGFLALVDINVLEEAFACFERAAALGSLEALFLKGRWLVCMVPVHGDVARGEAGKKLIVEAAKRDCARAIVYLAQCYEYPDRFAPLSFASDLPKDELAREKFILEYYFRAAELGDPDALNDVGSSYATGYGGLPFDFDKAVMYYVRAINAGSRHAFDNLGTHYETGMNGHGKDRVDCNKAVYYYRQGARMRCPKCAYNLAAAHEEGLPGAVTRDTARAEKYYRHAILLADDANDTAMAAKALKDLVALYITQIKLHAPQSDEARASHKRLTDYLPPKMLAATYADANAAIITATASGDLEPLNALLGDFNGRLISEHIRELQAQAKKRRGAKSAQNMLTHIFGRESSGVKRGGSDGGDNDLSPLNPEVVTTRSGGKRGRPAKRGTARTRAKRRKIT